MIVVDAHEDISWNALCLGRDPKISALATRAGEEGTETRQHGGLCMLGLPEWLLGRVGVIFTSIFVAPAAYSEGDWDKLVYHDAAEAFELGMRQVDFYRRLVEEAAPLTLITSSSELDAVLESWAPGRDVTEHKIGLVLMMEGADPIVEPPQVELWFEHGLRMIAPAWTATRYAGGTWDPGPLTELGYELLDAMSDLGMILDLSHLAEEAYYQAIERYDGPVVASHSNPRRFVPGERNLSDDMIRLLAERDGVMGIALYNPFLKEGWRKSDGKDAVRLADVVAVIDHVCQVVGDALHVGIGSDLDGGFGAESAPEGIDTVADLLKIADALAGYGYETDDIEAIMGGNFIRVLKAASTAW